MDDLFLGIDGGGTSTKAAVVRSDGRVVACEWAGPSNYDDVGIDVARQNIRQAVEALRGPAGMGSQPFRAVFLGMAGVVAPQDRQVIREDHHAPPRRRTARPDGTSGTRGDGAPRSSLWA